jgi:hypothetical protein
MYVYNHNPFVLFAAAFKVFFNIIFFRDCENWFIFFFKQNLAKEPTLFYLARLGLTFNLLLREDTCIHSPVRFGPVPPFLASLFDYGTALRN